MLISANRSDPTIDTLRTYPYISLPLLANPFVKSLAKQLASKGLRVNGVVPRPIWTPLQISGDAAVEHYTKFGGDYPLTRR
jgi:hypothetical protein